MTMPAQREAAAPKAEFTIHELYEIRSAILHCLDARRFWLYEGVSPEGNAIITEAGANDERLDLCNAIQEVLTARAKAALERGCSVMEATKRPWHSVNCAIYGPATPTGREASLAVCTRRVGVDPDVAVANAALIVRAVNSFESLLAAAKKMELVRAEYVALQFDPKSASFAFVEELFATLRTAIKAAEEGETNGTSIG